MTDLERAYKKGYKQGQKDAYQTYDEEVTDMSNGYAYRLKQLQKEIEALRCCGNCKIKQQQKQDYTSLKDIFTYIKLEQVCAQCVNKDKWEAKE